ncbi:hypothetical protein [Nocardioides sp. 616]|uniref:hypothetical protein n=1 Tax=Nocardioides sp. 616 TaxID=2268090 RepID=UPI0013B45E43|nr:hypothetical protein [Nocardioides sp. 616]
MTVRMRVSSLQPDEVGTYDALVATLGYEERSTAVAARLASRCSRIWAFDYQSEPLHSYERNAAFFAPYDIIRESPSAYRKSLGELIRLVRDSLARDESTGERVTPRIAVDISSMDRDRLARTVLACTEDQSEPIRVDFYYAFGEFVDDLRGSEGPVLVNRPMEGMEGWSSDPDSAVVCVLGLGFEQTLATAAIETIEPRQTVVLLPQGEDARYDAVVHEKNASLLRSGAVDTVHNYAVGDMRQTVVDLNASISTWSRANRVVVVPLGPKPLALAAILVAVANEHNVTVWRMSADDRRAAEERRATGTIVGLCVSVEPAPL